ncbi:OmpH family outer membrane protein [Undibacterium cyanobacteriorum]|uniref:OmpH family outer membrane protein n=1 Tax=Undibacterium cyanobacteriorum TaxID=3073561 RepID=A0ABY9RP32_9BURK|nr:OmpH family outer membrane protein [Undibacterium sp. 20NA77.5]WMW82440.1 OmpH family outer membrane protein [Undibacterium sp. 20NA77.5]
MSQTFYIARRLHYFYFLVLSLMCASMAQAQDIRVAFFDGQRVLNESLPAKVATAKIKQEFSKREKDLDELNEQLRAAVRKFEKEAPTMNELDRTRRQREISEMDQDFNRKQRIFSEDLGQRKQEEINILAERAQKVVRQIAEAEKIDLVVQDAVFFNPRIDITDKVLKALAK